MNPISVLLGPLSNLAGTIISRIWPDKTEQEKQQFILDYQAALLQSQEIAGQLQIDANEASNSNLYVAGWRPLIGWTCGLSFAWQFVITPILQTITATTGHPFVVPVFDTSTLNQVLLGMLGMGYGAARTFEKVMRLTK